MRRQLDDYVRQGLAPRVIAGKLKVPPGAVRSQLDRLRRRREEEAAAAASPNPET